MATTNRSPLDRTRRRELAAAAAGAAAPSLPWHAPAGRDSEMQPAGYAWDAVRAPAHLGRPALEILGADSGAVMRDPYRGDLYWLISAGESSTWAPLPDVDTYGTTCYVEVAPAGRTGGPGPYWIRLPEDAGGRLLTNAERLHDALAKVIAEEYPADVAQRLGLS